MFFINEMTEKKINNIANIIIELNTLLEEAAGKYSMPLTGVPKAGKSLISGGLDHVYKKSKDKYFIEKLSPDMEGKWTFDTGKLELAREMKNKLKDKNEFFDDRFVKIKNTHIPNLIKNFDKTVFDLGGIPSKENESFIDNIQKSSILNDKKFVPVVLSPDRQKSYEWQKFFNEKFETDPIIYTPNWNFKKDIKQQSIYHANELLNRIQKRL